jgi:hypothetical protein
MSKEQALHCGCGSFQQQAEADGKWNRVTLSKVQLCSYFTYTEIYDFRKDLKRKMANLTKTIHENSKLQ